MSHECTSLQVFGSECLLRKIIESYADSIAYSEQTHTRLEVLRALDDFCKDLFDSEQIEDRNQLLRILKTSANDLLNTLKRNRPNDVPGNVLKDYLLKYAPHLEPGIVRFIKNLKKLQEDSVVNLQKDIKNDATDLYSDADSIVKCLKSNINDRRLSSVLHFTNGYSFQEALQKNIDTIEPLVTRS